jgi:hypothetical protein
MIYLNILQKALNKKAIDQVKLALLSFGLM